MYLNTKNKKECTGCSACESICPQKCISMELDNEGFKYPNMNVNKCINCHLCEKVCPINLKIVPPNSEFVSGYAKSKDILDSSSSGGFNYGLSKYILDQGGYVFGVILDDELKSRHVCIHNIKDINSICKSKYIQSEISHIFEKVKLLLDENNLVMFTGTPCQVSGLRMFLNKDYDNLLLVDFTCHGVSSQLLFDDCIKREEKEKDIKIVSFTFRSKKLKHLTHPHNYSYKYIKKDKLKIRKGNYYNFPYYYAYKSYNFFRPSCYNCKYNSNKRISDITLSDFWKGQKFYKNMKVKNGISLLMLNTKKGKAIFNSILDNYNIKTHHKTDVNDFAGWKDCVIRDDKKRNILINKYIEMDINKFCKIYLKPNSIYKLKALIPYCIPLCLIRAKQRIGGIFK